MMILGVNALVGNTVYPNDFVSPTYSNVTTTNLTATNWYSGLQNVTDVLNRPYTPASYIIFINNSVTYLKNCTTGAIEYSSTNNTELFQYANDHMPDAGGKIYIDVGTYVFAYGVWADHSNVIWEGAGRGTNLTWIENWYLFTISGQYWGIEFRDLTFWSNYTGPGEQQAFVVMSWCNHSGVVDCYMYNARGHAIFTCGNRYCYYERNYINGSLNGAISISSGSGGGSQYNRVSGNFINGTQNAGTWGFEGVDVNGANGPTSYNVISDNVITNVGWGIGVDSAWNNIYTGNLIYNVYFGINIDSGSGAYCGGSIVADNNIYFIDDPATNWGCGIMINRGAENMLVTGNHINGSVSVTGSGTGIAMQGDNSLCEGNWITNMPLGIVMGSNNTMIIGNKLNQGNSAGLSMGVDGYPYTNNVTVADNYFSNYLTGVYLYAAPETNITIKDNYFIDCLDPINATLGTDVTIIGNSVESRPTAYYGTSVNATTTTFVFAHFLAGTPTGVWASFNATGITGYTWTANVTYVTLTMAGTPSEAVVTCYWQAFYQL